MLTRMTRIPPGFHSLHHNLAHEIIKHLNTKNVAKLRTTSKSVKNFGKDGATCQSERLPLYNELKITGTAISRRGQPVNFKAFIEPQVLHHPRDQTLDFQLKVFVCEAPALHAWGLGHMSTNETVYRWFDSATLPEQFVLDQVIGCISRECQVHAAYVASMYRSLLDSMVLETGPRTTAQVRTAARRVRQIRE